jgi:hypothetical protein
MVGRYLHNEQQFTQEEIVARVKRRESAGPDARDSAQRDEVLAALNPSLYEALTHFQPGDFQWIGMLFTKKGRREVVVDQQALNELPPYPRMAYSDDRLIAALRSGRPVVAALGGTRPGDSKHVVVIHGATIQPVTMRGAFNLPVKGEQVVSVTYTDPDSPSDPPTDDTMSGDELRRRADFTATTDVAEQYFRFVNGLAKIVTDKNTLAARQAAAASLAGSPTNLTGRR